MMGRMTLELEVERGFHELSAFDGDCSSRKPPTAPAPASHGKC